MPNRGIYMPSGLLLIGTKYYFRIRVPEPLVGRIARKEFRLSLRTGDRREAKKLSSLCGSIVRELFEKVRRGDSTLKRLRAEDVGNLVGEWLKRIVSDAEDRRNQGRFPVEVEALIHQSRSDASLDILSHLEYDDREALDDLQHIKRMKNEAIEILQEKRLNADESTLGLLCRELLTARCRYWEYERERVTNPMTNPQSVMNAILKRDGVISEDKIVHRTQPVRMDPVVLIHEKGSDQPQTPKLPMAEIVEEYIKFKTDEGAWRAHTASGTIPRLKKFVDFIGNPRADELTKDSLRQYRTYLIGSPVKRGTYWAKISKMSEKKRDGIILRGEVPEEARLSRDSVNGYITEINTFLKWAEIQHDLPPWSAQIIQRVKTSSGKGETVSEGESKRRAFTEEELRKIFSHEGFTGDSFTKAYQYWIPLIAMYSGARVEEIAQMRIDDIREAEGVLCFDINAKEDKQTKNATSIRLIPIHPILLQIGLQEYLEKLRKLGEKLLFPELAKKTPDEKSRYGNTVSSWFSDFAKKLGVGGPMNDEGQYSDTGKKASSHSFRNTFITKCRREKLETDMYRQVVGHSKGDTMTDRYIDKYSPKELLEGVIRKVSFPVDVERLKNSRFGIGKKS